MPNPVPKTAPTAPKEAPTAPPSIHYVDRQIVLRIPELCDIELTREELLQLYLDCRELLGTV